MDDVFDVELFLAYLSCSIIEHPNLRNDLEEYYKTDKYKFFEKARHSEYYNHPVLIDGTLEKEVSAKRVFGILLCAEEDEAVREFVFKKLINIYPQVKIFVKKPNKQAFRDISDYLKRNLLTTTGTYQKKNAPFRFAGYLLYVKYGADCNNEDIKDFISQINADNIRRNNYVLDERNREHIKTVDFENVRTDKNARKLFDKIRTGYDICGFMDFIDRDIFKVAVGAINPELANFISNFPVAPPEAVDFTRALRIIYLFSQVLFINGYSASEQFGSDVVTKDEQNRIIQILSEVYPVLSVDTGEYDERDENGNYKMLISDYLTGFLFLLMIKEMRNMREFYFRNNSETQYLELQRLESVIEDKDNEIEHLKAELAKASEQGKRQREEIKRLTDEAFKENKDAIRPYTSEISELHGIIRDLEKALNAEQAKAPELNALREFAFSVQSEYMPTEDAVTLSELIRGKKIIIVGGHINWRNKMKTRYPSVSFLDGHNATLDNAVFNNADFILLNTSNMAHKVYYKVIDYLRDRKLKFDYIGRSINQELLEAEIASILKDKM